MPPGRRVYAIGDVHGCTQLLGRLLKLLVADREKRAPVRTDIVLLGDLIDRGEDSGRLIASLSEKKSGRRLHPIMGNHEATLIDALAGDHSAMDLWLAHGGDATLRSLGVPASAIDPDDSARMIALARERVTPKMRRWLQNLPTHLRIGDYFFAHAGVRPGVPLGRQKPEDLMWIRAPFTGSSADHGAIIVHGHTVNEGGVAFLPNRIGVDTGAYWTGQLSAVGLEGDEQWEIST